MNDRKGFTVEPTRPDPSRTEEAPGVSEGVLLILLASVCFVLGFVVGYVVLLGPGH